jgi:hypothetical protein
VLKRNPLWDRDEWSTGPGQGNLLGRFPAEQARPGEVHIQLSHEPLWMNADADPRPQPP